MPTGIVLLLLPLIMLGCVSAKASSGPTLWASINNYHDEMRNLESRPELWPDRQRLAESTKIAYVATFGGSREFNRLVDLDVRRREFLIALRDPRLKPERKKEIEQELLVLGQQIEILQPLVKEQMIAAQLRVQEASPTTTIESIATVGLLNLAIDEFSPVTGRGEAPVTRVGPYTVTAQGLSSEVLTPQGRVFRCATTLLSEQAASIDCKPLSN